MHAFLCYLDQYYSAEIANAKCSPLSSFPPFDGPFYQTADKKSDIPIQKLQTLNQWCYVLLQGVGNCVSQERKRPQNSPPPLVVQCGIHYNLVYQSKTCQPKFFHIFSLSNFPSFFGLRPLSLTAFISCGVCLRSLPPCHRVYVSRYTLGFLIKKSMPQQTL